MNFKNLIRKIIYPFCYAYYFLKKHKLNKSYNGDKLQRGISAVISMKDEEYTIEACIRSLQGFADQIICIDNGSTDESVGIVKKLQKEYKYLEIIEMPGALLGDCRNEGLKRTNYNWHLRWDADMIAHTSGPNSILNLKQNILLSDRPRSVQLPRINLNGDFFHTTEGEISDDGEPILMRYTKDIIYQEFGKFDSIKVPFYYQQIKEKKNYYLHCQGLKSDENLIHRFHYFTWRKYTNEFHNFRLSKEDFIAKRNRYYFGTNDLRKINFRYQRQNVKRFVKYKVEDYIDYPEALKELMKKNNRFEIIYVNEKPYTRIDNFSTSMQNFKPDDEDLKWSVEEFFRKVDSESYLKYLNR